ncbi:MAG TPA: hypothetical protein VFI54_10075 [Solirubrobacteraceae bacterium]|nr:hypothetical protein [Solirubrobacteraceae bacterium]
MPNDTIIQSLVGMRGAVGTGAWLAPRLSGRLFGLDPAANPQASYLGRLFAVRDAALAFGLSTSTGRERAQWLRIGIAWDLADAAAGLLAGRRGDLPARATILVTGTALTGAALGIVALKGEEPAL